MDNMNTYVRVYWIERFTVLIKRSEHECGYRGCLVLIGKTRCPLTGSLHWQIVKWVYAPRNCADNLTQCHGVTSKLAK